MSMKKVKNASMSGTVNKKFGAGTKPKVTVVEKKEVETVGDLVDTIDAKLDVSTTVVDNTDSFDEDVPMSLEARIDAGTDVDFSFGRQTLDLRDRTQRERGTGYDDAPIVYIAGVKHTPVKMDMPPKGLGDNVYYYSRTDNPLSVSGSPGQRFGPDEVITKENIRWHHVALPEIDVYVTQGSELTIDDRVTSYTGWEGDDGDWINMPKGKKPELFIIGSQVRCRSISLSSSVEFNNSIVETNGHIDTVNARVTGCRLNAVQSIDLYNCGIYTSRIDSINRLNIRDSKYIRNMGLGGFDSVELFKVHNSGEFRIHTGWTPVSGLSLKISECHLTEFIGDFRGFGELFAKEYGGKQPWHGNGMFIRRRTDYGYFSGSSPVPFVRCGDYNIATPHNLFLANEIDSVSFPKEKKDLTYQPQFGGGMMRNDYVSIGDDNSYTMGMRGGKLWEKARKDCFPNARNIPEEKRPIGVIGDNLIQSLVEQIKSRTKLYVEMAVLVEV